MVKNNLHQHFIQTARLSTTASTHHGLDRTTGLQERVDCILLAIGESRVVESLTSTEFFQLIISDLELHSPMSNNNVLYSSHD